MKKLNKILLATGLTCMFAASSFAVDLATYKGGKVTEAEIMKELAPVFAQHPELKGKKFTDLDQALKTNFVKSYVSSKLLEKEAKKQNIEESQSFKEKLTAVKKQLAQQELITKITSKASTQEKIDAEYMNLVKELKGKQEVKASHILVKTEKDALDLKKKLGSKGKNFAKLAQEYSEDPGSKTKGGELGYFTNGQMVPEFEKAVFSMKVGSVSDPIKTDFGYHIIKLEDKRDIKVPSKEEASKPLANKLNQMAMQEYMTKLEKDADVKLKF